jgi:hypothetical protein
MLSSTDVLQRWLRHVPAPRAGSCASRGCTITPTRRRWCTAGRKWGSCPWSSRSRAIGRRRVRSGARRTRNGVRPAGNGSCACGLSCAVGLLHSPWLGYVQHDAVWQADACQRRRVPGACRVGAPRGLGGTRRALSMPGTRTTPVRGGRPGPVAGARAWG